ncbi:MAG: matrixin family metalloprotease [Actinomycetota bacterium]|jgi:hypothetical protein|nr:matrixin family metalloprotease [Actinomycetota bacterium]MDP9459085.1 matrixin family metalloprotease [Actinomycetota bacterium]
MPSSRARLVLRRASAWFLVLAVALVVPPATTSAATSASASTSAVLSEVTAPTPADVPAGPPYRLYRNPDGSPVRFDPCRPLRVRLNAPSSAAEADAREALDRLAAVSGLAFSLEGRTEFVPSRAERTLAGTELVIAWAPPAGAPGGSDLLGADQLGTGGWTSQGQRSDGGVVWRATGGFAVLDVTRDAQLDPGFGPGLTRGALLLHEIAHALGVDHVDDPSQLMSPRLQRRETPVALGAGDLAALRAVGATAGCLPG